MNTIVAAVDGSEPSLRALRMAAGLAAKFGARLVMAYAVEPVTLPADAFPVPLAEIEASHHAWAERMLAGAIERLELPKPVVRRVVDGPPAAAILKVAKEEKADLVTVGSRGRGAFKRALLGSVSDRIVRTAECAVLIVH